MEIDELKLNETECSASASVMAPPSVEPTLNDVEGDTPSNESESGFVDTPLNGVVPSFSFSGCGFLGVYHVGVAACLREHTDVVNRPEIKFAGASAGALVATTLLCGMNFGEMAKILLDVATAVRDKEAHDLRGQLMGVLEHYLPEDAHVKLSHRLYVSVTVMDGMECGLVTEFKSKQHLIQCLIATCFVPGFLGWLPPSISADSFEEVGDIFPKLGEKEKKKKREKNRNEADNDHRTAEQREEEEEEKIKVIPSESILDVISCDANSASGRVSESNRSYIQMLLDLCLRSITTTSQVVQKLPGVPRSVCSTLEGFDDFVIDILREMLSGDMKYMSFDGGFSDNIPSFDSNTITVCPFAGESDICPRDLTALDISLDLGNTSMQASEDNIFRLSHALNPMEPGLLLTLCTEGYNDCLRYLHKKDLLGCKQHLMTRALLHSSPCNIGHAHCNCPICQASDPNIRGALSCVTCQKVKKRALESDLPEDVTKEFLKAIQKHQTRRKPRSVRDTNLLRLGGMLWTTVERMYSSTIGAANAAIRFQIWLVGFLDNFVPMIKYHVLRTDQKMKVVRYMLSSLNHFLREAKGLSLMHPCSVLQKLHL